MTREATVAVIIPTYNRPELVAKAVESVLAQDPRPEQIIVVDDGHEPSSQPKLAEWAAAGFIQLIHEGNRGLPGARNRGAREATTDFLHFLDDDDALAPGGLAALRDALIGHPDAVGAVGGGRRYFASRQQFGEVEWPGDDQMDFAGLTAGNPFFVGAVMVRRSAFVAAGGFAQDVPLAEDWDMWLRLARIGRFTLPRVDVVMYCVHGANMSRSSKVARLTLTLVRHYLRGFSSAERRQFGPALSSYLARTYFSEALWYLRVAVRRGQGRAALQECALCWGIMVTAARYPQGRTALRAAVRRHRKGL